MVLSSNFLHGKVKQTQAKVRCKIEFGGSLPHHNDKLYIIGQSVYVHHLPNQCTFSARFELLKARDLSQIVPLLEGT